MWCCGKSAKNEWDEMYAMDDFLRDPRDSSGNKHMKEMPLDSNTPPSPTIHTPKMKVPEGSRTDSDALKHDSIFAKLQPSTAYRKKKEFQNEQQRDERSSSKSSVFKSIFSLLRPSSEVSNVLF